MAKQVINLGNDNIGLVIGNLTFSFCKQISDNSNVNISGATLTEHGKGLYILNVTITEDSTFYIYETGTPANYAVGIFSNEDGDLALETSLAVVDGNVDAIKADTDAYLDAAISGVSTLTAQQVWEYATRTLSSFGSLISNIWSNGTRTLTAGTKDSEIDAILVDTNELQLDLTNGGRLDSLIDSIITHLTDLKGVGWTDENIKNIDSLIDSIKTVTDTFTFTGSNVNANAQDVTLDGTDTAAIAIAVESKIAILHGSGAYDINGVGARAVTIIFYETGTLTPIINMDVTLKLSGVVERIGTTDSNGQVVFNLDDNTYTVHPYKSKVNIDDSTSIVVNISATTFTIYGDTISPTVPSADLQTLYGNLKKLNLTSYANVTVKATITKQQIVSSIVLSKQILSTTTNVNGYFELQVAQGSKIKLEIGIDYNKIITITTDVTKDISTY